MAQQIGPFAATVRRNIHPTSIVILAEYKQSNVMYSTIYRYVKRSNATVACACVQIRGGRLYLVRAQRRTTVSIWYLSCFSLKGWAFFFFQISVGGLAPVARYFAALTPLTRILAKRRGAWYSRESPSRAPGSNETVSINHVLIEGCVQPQSSEPGCFQIFHLADDQSSQLMCPKEGSFFLCLISKYLSRASAATWQM